eukprot:1643298-Pyramimonas_sp.AAC.1
MALPVQLRRAGRRGHEQHCAGDESESGDLHLALASARVMIKKGDPIVARECANYHNTVMQELSSPSNASRFTE